MDIESKFNLIQFKKLDFIKEAIAPTKIKNIFCLKTKTPLYAQYEITANCNYKCSFCYNVWKNNNKKNSFKKGELNKVQQLEIIDKLAELEIFGLIISGGEPLVDPHLIDVVKRAVKKHHIETSIITNGSLLTEENCRKLKEAGLSDMQISLHSFKPKLNDKLTQTRNSFYKTLNGIKNALKYFGSSNININMVPTKQTYKQVYNMAKFLKEIGITNFSASSFVSR